MATLILSIVSLILGVALQPLYEIFQKKIVTPFDKLPPIVKRLVLVVFAFGANLATQAGIPMEGDFTKWTAAGLGAIISAVVAMIVHKFVKSPTSSAPSA